MFANTGFFKLARRVRWIQVLVIKSVARIHPTIYHNVEKILAFKKAFFWVDLDNTEGDYVEIGMFEGNSFIGALESHLISKQPGTPDRVFWGFDSFEGFKYFSARDKHPFWKQGQLKVNYEVTRKRVEKYFRNRAAWHITRGYVEETVGGKSALEFGIKRIAVAFIDCDLGEPTRVALDFMRPALQEGSIIILDDYFAYRGSLCQGEAGAFRDFREKYPELVFRRMFDYGLGGRAYILANVLDPASSK